MIVVQLAVKVDDAERGPISIPSAGSGSAEREEGAMRTVEFKFEPKDRVQTTLGDVGIVASCLIDSGPDLQYYIIHKGGAGAWYPEEQLSFAAEE